MAVGSPVVALPQRTTLKLKIHTGSFSVSGAPILRTESYVLKHTASHQDAKDFAFQLGMMLTAPESLHHVLRMDETILGINEGAGGKGQGASFKSFS